MRKLNVELMLVCAMAVLVGAAPFAFGDWDEGDTHKMHWPQLPDLNTTGMDVLAGPLSADPVNQLYYEIFLADDFQCSADGPITGIHIWCSYHSDLVLPGTPSFSLVIFEDIPAGPGGIPYSRPGLPVWDAYLQPTAIRVYEPNVVESFYDPTQDEIIGLDFTVYQVNFIIDETDAFVQEEGKIYWLGLHHTFDLDNDGSVFVNDLNMLAFSWPSVFGWKTADPNRMEHFNDDAVWADVSTWRLDPHIVPTDEEWNELRYPAGHPYEYQSIDLAFVIDGPVQSKDIDWGDAPEDAAGGGYPTTSANSGASHIIDGPYLGSISDAPDAETDGQPDPGALGDDLDGDGDDENGVTIPIPLVEGQPGDIDVEVNGGGGYLNVWVDWNGDQDWDDPGELVFSGLVPDGVVIIPVTPPVGSTNITFLRARINTTGLLTPYGPADDGEVEDHEIFIEEGDQTLDPLIKFQQLPMDGPDYYGHDEISTAYTNGDFTNPIEPVIFGYYGCYMADDFADYKDTPVVRIKWWGSYPENDYMTINRFLITFEDDVPAIGNPGDIDYEPSHPGIPLSSEIVELSSSVPNALKPGEFTEEWLLNSGGQPCFEDLYEYEAVLEHPFPQEPNTVYWLKIVALVDVNPATMGQLQDCLAASGVDICTYLNMPRSEQEHICDVLMEESPRLPRWGIHSRDYTVRNPYAAVPPAVVPGERLAGIVVDLINGIDLEVWHFQDDAVSGEVDIYIDPSDPNFIEPFQWIWNPENYKYFPPLWCDIGPIGVGVDGPGGIVNYSKDLAFVLFTEDILPPELDWGDAPELPGGGGYPTTSGNSGASHIIGGPWLGPLDDKPDAETDGQPNGTATGDDTDADGDDEDGVTIPLPLVEGQPGVINVEVNGVGAGAILDVWVDWNGDLDWTDAGEQIFSGPVVLDGIVAIAVVPPLGSAGTTFLRARINSAAPLLPEGPADDGEVEDHQIVIDPAPTEPEPTILKFQQLPLNGPTYFGHDELSTVYTFYDYRNGGQGDPVGYWGCYMADDFADLRNTDITEITWWGSYLEEVFYSVPHVQRFLISFEEDIPAVGKPGDATYIPSHPGAVLSTEIVNLGTLGALTQGQFSEEPKGPGGMPCLEPLYKYHAVLTKPFPEKANTVYWLKIVAIVDIDPILGGELEGCIDNVLPGTWCDFLNKPRQEQLDACPGLDGWLPITRWGWHNRDYTIHDPYAAVPPAVIPGEHPAGIVIDPINGLDIEIWHFQDDAVSGDITMDLNPLDPFIVQSTWAEQNYIYNSPLCPFGPGIDGPDEIVNFSKDLAFELFTNYCWTGDPASAAEWLLVGAPECWCKNFNARQCYGDADNSPQGRFNYYVSTDDLNILSDAWNKNLAATLGTGTEGDGMSNGTPWICADFDHQAQGRFLYRVSTDDLNVLSNNWNIPSGPAPNCQDTLGVQP